MTVSHSIPNTACPIRLIDDTQWGEAGTAPQPGRDLHGWLEDGCVLHFPQLAFELHAAERALLDPSLAEPKAKNITLRAASGELRGARGSVQQRAALHALVTRFREHAVALVDRLFPHYRGHLAMANTTYRPIAVGARQTSWRKDDTRLHVDAFPSNPTQGLRLLRVFTNLGGTGIARAWRVGENFEAFARRHVGQIAPAWPGSAWLLHQLRITKRRRTAYDHLMLQLHDRAKADTEWQRSSAQQAVDFAPGSTWLVFSDQVLHAAMAGQFMMEQTFTLNPDDQCDPSKSPLQVLQRLTGRSQRH